MKFCVSTISPSKTLMKQGDDEKRGHISQKEAFVAEVEGPPAFRGDGRFARV